MRPRKFLPLSLILLPLIALASLNCGIIALPIEGPKVLIVNAKTLKFSVDIVDEAGKPLEGVKVLAIRHALSPDLLFVETVENKPDTPKTIDRKFEYKTFGNYAVEVRYEKSGYRVHTCIYGEGDNIQMAHRGFMSLPVFLDEKININKQPHSTVTLTKESQASQPPPS